MSFTNHVRTAALLGILTVILIAIGGFLGGEQGLLFGFMFALILNFISYWFSDKIVLAIYRAKEIRREDNPMLYRLVDGVRQKFGLPMPKLYLIQNPSPNAFATGRNPEHSAIAFTTGILQLLDEQELEGVIAHEFSHIKNMDILIASVAAVIAGTIAYIAMMARFAAIFGRNDDRGQGLLELIAIGIVTPIIATIVQLAISRSREYLADETAARMLRNSLGLRNGLAKLEGMTARRPMAEANPGTAHMFIVNPFSAKGLVGLLSTHPAVEERIARLEKLRY